MPFRLQANIQFFAVTQAPVMCLFSGRIDRLAHQPLTLYLPAAGNGLATLLTRGLPWLGTPTVLQVPCAPGELWRWRFYSQRAYLPLLAGLLVGGLVLGLYTNPFNPALGPLIAAGAVALSALITSIYLPLARRNCIRLGLTDRRGNLTIIFPSSREHIFWAYQKVYQQWLTTQPAGLFPAASGRQPAPAPLPAT